MDKQERSRSSPIWRPVLYLYGLQGVSIFLNLIFIPLFNYPFPAEESSIGMLLCSIMITVLYGYGIYSRVWRLGARDFNIVKYAHMEHNPRRGLCLGLLAGAPGILISLAALINAFLGYPMEFMTPIYRVYYFFCNGIIFVLEPYTPLILLFPCVLLIGISSGAYALGYRQIRLMDRIVYRKVRPDKKKRKFPR